MRRRPRLVVDTNVLVSAFLWQGTPGRLVELAGEHIIRLFTSRALLAELDAVLHRRKLAKAVAATGLTAGDMLANYRKLATVVSVRPLAAPVSRDADDDDLLTLQCFEGIPIVSTAQALAMIE